MVFYCRVNKYGYNDRSEVTFSKRYEGDNPDAPGTVVTAENRTYDYDPIGSRKESVGCNEAANAQQSLIYECNVLNQYTAVTEGGAALASPVYDNDGNMTAYKDKSCTWNAESRLVLVETADKKVNFFYDYMGRRVRKQFYATGVIVAHYEYDAFGNTVAQLGVYAEENAFRFSTQYFDVETGVYYYGFRYYAPEIGWWGNGEKIGIRSKWKRLIH